MSPTTQSTQTLLIDSHCHLDMEMYEEELDQIIKNASLAGVSQIITIGINAASSVKAVQIAEKYSSVYAAVGVHPHDADDVSEDDFATLSRLTAHEKVVGYGEIGLDYAKMYSPKDRQQEVFSRQLDMAKKFALPVIIHDREAHEDTLEILRRLAPFPAGGVMHCFSGDVDFARQVLELDFYISIPGIVTFKNAKALQQVVCEIPLQAMLLETDGPFLSPVPFRGKRNMPEYLLYTAKKIAELRSTTLEAVASSTTGNTRALFNLPAS